jgi:hypothetical protein
MVFSDSPECLRFGDIPSPVMVITAYARAQGEVFKVLLYFVNPTISISDGKNRDVVSMRESVEVIVVMQDTV